MCKKVNSELEMAKSLKQLIDAECAAALAETASDEVIANFYSKKFTIAFGDAKLIAACGPEILDAVSRALDVFIDYNE